jgi:SAM-dependent methyltransferase
VSDWFEEWFGEEYLSIYPHRDEREAEAMLRLIDGQVASDAPVRALDLACGPGRHTRAMTDRWWTLGLDLSPALLRVARAADRSLPLVRADMRLLPFADAAFDLVVNLFTSFGYFRDDAQHVRVVQEVRRVCSARAWFVLDYLNAPEVRANLIPFDERRVGSRVVEQERSISSDGRYVCKTIMLWDEGRMFTERVRLFDADELCRMLECSGFVVVRRVGDYAGAPHSDHSPRLILFARAA